MEEIIDSLVKKIENRTIRLKDFCESLEKEKMDNCINFVSLICENDVINNYLGSFFDGKKYTEEEIINKYGDEEGNILISYAIIKNFIKEEVIDFEETEDIKSLDSLDLFFKDIKDLPILSREENIMYVKLYQENKKLGNKALCKYYQNLIIEGNIRLIIYVAKSFTCPEIPLEDLISEGFFGIVRAIECFDSSYDCAFSTYAIYWIKQRITRSIYNNNRSIRLPLHIQLKHRKYAIAKKELSNKLGRNATNEEVAIAMGESVESINELVGSIKEVTSLDEKISDDYKSDRYNFAVSDASFFEDEVVNKETILKLMSCLSEKEKDIIMKRFFLKYTLEVIGKMYGVSRERIRQVVDKALFKMRNFSKIKVTIMDEKTGRLILDYKTLKDVIGEEKVNDFDSYIQVNSRMRLIYFKAFGENLDKVYDESNLERQEVYDLKASIKRVMRKNGTGIGKKYDNKTLEEIFRLASNMSDESIREAKNKWWRKAMVSDDDSTSVLVKAFGVNGDDPCALKTLNSEERMKLRIKLDYWIVRLSEESNKKKNSYAYRTLNEILELSFEDTMYFMSTLDKTSHLYRTIIRVFGEDLKGYLNKDELEKEEYKKLISGLSAMKEVVERNNNFKGKYLNDIVQINLSDIAGLVSVEELGLLKVAFGNNLDRRFINTVGIKSLSKVINHINRQTKNENVNEENESKDKSMYDNMTLDMILDISYEEVLVIFNKTRKGTSTYNIFVKAFGEDLKGAFNIESLNRSERLILYNKIASLKSKVSLEKEECQKRCKKSIYDNMTLDMILGISYEEVLGVFNEYRKDTNIYKIFVKTFGEDFKGTFDLSHLNDSEKLTIYNKINRLKKKLLTELKNNDLDEYHMCIISLMPQEYKTILTLYFENCSLDEIANLTGLNVNDVNNKLKEGISFMKKVISLYNRTFDGDIPENEKMLR